MVDLFVKYVIYVNGLSARVGGISASRVMNVAIIFKTNKTKQAPRNTHS